MFLALLTIGLGQGYAGLHEIRIGAEGPPKGRDGVLGFTVLAVCFSDLVLRLGIVRVDLQLCVQLVKRLPPGVRVWGVLGIELERLAIGVDCSLPVSLRSRDFSRHLVTAGRMRRDLHQPQVNLRR